MSKIIVTPKNEKHLNKLLDDKIDAVLLSIENLSINSEYYISLNKNNYVFQKESLIWLILQLINWIRQNVQSVSEIMLY